MTTLLEWVTDLLEYLNQTLAKPRKGFLNHLDPPRYTPGCCQIFSANPWLRWSLHRNLFIGFATCKNGQLQYYVVFIVNCCMLLVC